MNPWLRRQVLRLVALGLAIATWIAVRRLLHL